MPRNGNGVCPAGLAVLESSLDVLLLTFVVSQLADVGRSFVSKSSERC